MSDKWLDRWDRQANDHPVRFGIKVLGLAIVIIVILTVIVNALGLANIYWEAARSKITAQPRVTKSVYETQNIIGKVAFFHERCTGVKEKLAIFENNYARLLAAREAAKLKTDPLERQAAVQELTGAQQDTTAALNAAQSDAAAYNAAAANPNVAPFRTIFHQNGLPERIELPPGETAASTYLINCG